MIYDALRLLAERRDFFLALLLEHLQIAGLSALLAGGIGVALGVAISEYRRAAPLVMQAGNILYTVPSIAMFGLLMPVTGIGNATAIVALTLYGLLPVVGHTHAGMQGIAPAVIDAATGLGTPRGALLWRIKLPLALPAILAALRTMTVMTIALAGIASFIGAGGLGVAIYRGITTNNGAMTLAGSLLIMALAFAADGLLAWAQKRIPWRQTP